MLFARTINGNIEFGEFDELWPNTSTFSKTTFARNHGFSEVVSILPHEEEVQTLQKCQVYSLNGCFYDVEVVNRPLQDIQPVITLLVQRRLDEFVATRGYDSILSACTYATSSIPKFQSEGQAAVDARDATWAACYAILASIQGGARPMPTMEEFIAELPILVWPA